MAFDADGNLWVVSDGNLVRFDAERLTDSTSDPADRTLTVTGPGGGSEFTASDLAFDAEGDLWVTDFGANVVFGVSQGDLSGSGDDTVEAVVQLTLPVSALLSRPAFDESGGLWLGLGGGGVGRIAPEQLTVSTDAGDPTRPEVLITSADLGSVERIAFFPAASDLPLYHALP